MFLTLSSFLDKGKYWYYGCVIFSLAHTVPPEKILHDNESDVSNRLGFSSNPEKKPGIFVQNYLNTSILVSLC